MITLIIGPSAVGKTTIVNELLSCPESSSLLGHPIVTITTRAPRDEDENYQYATIAEFDRLLKEERFAEWANVHGNYYGTLKDYFLDTDLTKNFYKVIDYQGALKLIDEFGANRFTTVFIYPRSLSELKQRLQKRNDGNENIRLSNALHEMTQANKFDYVLINEDVNETSLNLKRILLRRSVVI